MCSLVVQTSGQLYVQLLGLDLWLSGGMTGNITRVEKVFQQPDCNQQEELDKQDSMYRLVVHIYICINVMYCV